MVRRFVNINDTKKAKENIITPFCVVASTEENSFETITLDMKYPSICTQKGETSDVKNLSNSCRNALETLYDCLFFFFLLLMYTICQGVRTAIKAGQIFFTTEVVFSWCNNGEWIRALIIYNQLDSVSNQSSGRKGNFLRSQGKKILSKYSK